MNGEQWRVKGVARAKGRRRWWQLGKKQVEEEKNEVNNLRRTKEDEDADGLKGHWIQKNAKDTMISGFKGSKQLVRQH